MESTLTILKKKLAILLFGDEWAHNKKGVKSKNIEHSIAEFTKAIEINPEFALAYSNRAYSFFKLKNYLNSIKDYSKAIDLDPSHQKLGSYVQRGICKLNLSDYNGAILDFTESIELYISTLTNYHPEFRIVKRKSLQVEAYYFRAKSKVKIKDYKGAIDDYSKAIEINPEFVWAYSERGFAKGHSYTEIHDEVKKLINGDYIGAISDYSKAIELNKNEAKFYNSRGSMKVRIRNFQDAVVDFTKAIELNPENANSFFNRGKTKNLLEDYRGAVEDFTFVLNKLPQNAEAYYFRGLAFIKLGQKNTGCLDLSRSGELGYGSAYEAIKANCGSV
ncbi:MAG: tetratricopeptide repeat protein [Saprospiraceae bacterium]|nr:tetratricopeptide repeat protein [Saprospiraceae bacterium]